MVDGFIACNPDSTGKKLQTFNNAVGVEPSVHAEGMVIVDIAGVPIAVATETTLALVKAKTDNLDVALSLIKAKTDNLDVALSLIKAKTDNLDVALSTRALEVGGNLATIAGKDFATQTTLASILAQFDNKTSTLATETTLGTVHGHVDSIDTKVATETTLAFIKAKTDNIDTASSLLAKETTLGTVHGHVDSMDTKLTSMVKEATTPVVYNVTMTNANAEYSQALPANTKKFLIHTQDETAFRFAFVTGKVATPTAPWLTVLAGSRYFEDMVLTSATLYFASASAGKIIEVVAWS